MTFRPDASAVEVAGTSAIEVVTQFESAVIDARHLADPVPAQPSRLTRALLGGGAAALAGAGGLFLYTYVEVVRWREAGALPESAPRGFGADVAMTLLLAGGVWALLGGLGRLFRERAPRDFTIGTDASAQVATPEGALPAARFPLVRAAGDRWELLITREMSGEVTVGGQAITLAELVARDQCRRSDLDGALAWPIAGGARVRIALGLLTFHISEVAQPRHHQAPLPFDWRQQGYTAACAVAAALFLGIIFAIPPDPIGLSVDDLMKDRRFPVFVIKAPDQPEQPEPLQRGPRTNHRGGDAGGRAKGVAGKLGNPKETAQNRRYQIKGPPDTARIQMGKKMAYDLASKTAVLGVLRDLQTSQIGAIFSPDDTALGRDATSAMGNLTGRETGDANGAGGLDLLGKGPGGGGTQNTIGLTNLPTIGHDGLHPGDYGRRVGSLNDKKHDAKIEAPQPDFRVIGQIDKEIVKRVIHQHRKEVQYCYEKELLSKPELYGRVVTQFLIANNGRVLASSIMQSTMHDAEVEKCVADAVKRWEFPQVAKAPVVTVQYPFAFRQAGQ